MSEMAVDRVTEELEWAERDYRYYAQHVADTHYRYLQAQQSFEDAKDALEQARQAYNEAMA